MVLAEPTPSNLFVSGAFLRHRLTSGLRRSLPSRQLKLRTERQRHFREICHRESFANAHRSVNFQTTCSFHGLKESLALLGAEIICRLPLFSSKAPNTPLAVLALGPIVTGVTGYVYETFGKHWVGLRNLPPHSLQLVPSRIRKLFWCLWGLYVVALLCKVPATFSSRLPEPNNFMVQHPAYSELMAPSSRARLFLVVLLVCVIVPILEEYVYRWVFMGRLMAGGTRAVAAVLTSSAIFSLNHHLGWLLGSLSFLLFSYPSLSAAANRLIASARSCPDPHQRSEQMRSARLYLRHVNGLRHQARHLLQPWTLVTHALNYMPMALAAGCAYVATRGSLLLPILTHILANSLAVLYCLRAPRHAPPPNDSPTA